MVNASSSRSRRGAGSIGCLTTLVVVVAVIFLAVQLGKPWFRYQQFRDVMKSSARYAVSLPDSVIRSRLMASADSLGLPKDAKRLKIVRSRSPANITISSEYIENVKLPLYGLLKIHFNPRAEEAL
ncbi:MAG: hypothetical protein V4558_12960 [Gemmatimonadota bacterium]